MVDKNVPALMISIQNQFKKKQRYGFVAQKQ